MNAAIAGKLDDDMAAILGLDRAVFSSQVAPPRAPVRRRLLTAAGVVGLGAAAIVLVGVIPFKTPVPAPAPAYVSPQVSAAAQRVGNPASVAPQLPATDELIAGRSGPGPQASPSGPGPLRLARPAAKLPAPADTAGEDRVTEVAVTTERSQPARAIGSGPREIKVDADTRAPRAGAPRATLTTAAAAANQPDASAPTSRQQQTVGDDQAKPARRSDERREALDAIRSLRR